MTILDTLADLAKQRVAQAKQSLPTETLRDKAYTLYETSGSQRDFPFEKALKSPGLSLICEVKKASPSKGVIANHFPYVDIAREYHAGGADCISVLTEPAYFMGNLSYLTEIHQEVPTPLLRKDFTVDPYMIYEAKISGASAILLIAAILKDDELREMARIAESLGLSVLFEAHDPDEIQRCLAAGARILGVNNRNLKDFTVNPENSISMRSYIPDSVTFVAESGVTGLEDLKRLQEHDVDAVLVGEALMRQENPCEVLDYWKQQLS